MDKSTAELGAQRGLNGRHWQVFLAACAAAVLAGCAAGGQVGQAERWHMTDAQAPASAEPIKGAPTSAVHVVFFRQDQAGPASRAKQPINLYINGQYQASLVGNTYTEHTLCPGTQRVAASLNDVRRRYTTKESGQPLLVSREPVQYFRVSESAAGATSVQPATAAEAQASGSLRQRQAQTISRVVRNGCAA